MTEDRAPFRRWLSDYVARCGGDTQLAAIQLRLRQQDVDAQLYATTSSVPLSTLDRFFTVAGEPHMLALLYPLAS